MTELDSLEIRVQDGAQSAASGIDKLVSSLTRLKSTSRGGAGLTSTVRGLDQLGAALGRINAASAGLTTLRSTLSALSSFSGVKTNVGTVANQISKLNAAVSALKVDNGKISELVSTLNSLGQVQKAEGLNSVVRALKQLPEITKSLSSSELRKFGLQMQLVAKYVAPLATEMEKVSKGFSALPIRIQKIIQSNAGLAASNKRAAGSFTDLAAKAASYLYILRRVVFFLADCVTSINEYVENVNLFQVSMGEFYEEAFDYAQLVSDKLGVDPSEWMRTQGVFMSIANGFGIAKDQAYALSEGLTELSYDLSSLYNEDMESSALRLQSALAGEIEPIRRLGIAISEASLKEFALEKGITASVESMTEQEKALLRTMKLMEGAANLGAIGDFARTLESPANALRVLNQQITQFKRAIGSVMLPVLIQILPYVQAFVSLLTDAISALATLVGFTMPEWDANDWGSGITTGATDATDAIEDATAAAKELKNATIGIDELNILPSSGGGSGAGAGTSGGADWTSGVEIPDIWNKDELEAMTSKVDELKEKLKPVLETALLIGAAIAGWKIASSLVTGLAALKTSLETVGSKASGLKFTLGTMSISAGLALAIENVTAVLSGEYSNTSATSILKTALSGVLTGLGLVLLGASAWAIPIAVALAFAVTNIVVNWDEFKTMWSAELDALKSIFTGDIRGFWDAINEAFVAWMQIDGLDQKLGKLILGEDVWNAALEYFQNDGTVQDVFNYVGEVISEKFSGAADAVKGFFGPVVTWFSGATEEIGGFFSGLWTDIRGTWSTVAGWFNSNIIQPLIGFFTQLKDTVSGVFEGTWLIIQAVWSIVSGWFNDNVITPVREFFSGLCQSIGGFFSDLWAQITAVWAVVSEWFDSYVIQPVVGVFKAAAEKISGFFSAVWDGIKSGVVAALNGAIGAVESFLNFIVSGVNGFLGGFNKVASWAGDVLGKDWAGVGQMSKVSLGRITAYAEGGFPETGQLFLANEAGPEMVGQIGRQTAVANNDQIVEGIASANTGVINAVMAIGSMIVKAIEEQDYSTYLDGRMVSRMLYSYNKQTSREMGPRLVTRG